MKKLGYLFIILGFLGGSLVSVLEELAVSWWKFSGFFLLGVVGIFLVRRHDRQSRKSETAMATHMEEIRASLSRIVSNLIQLNVTRESIPVHEIRHHLDSLFAKDIECFVDSREGLVHVYGLTSYAEVMSHFASGERYLNRVWSASTDGYIDEVVTYLDKAQKRFSEAMAKVKSLESTRG